MSGSISVPTAYNELVSGLASFVTSAGAVLATDASFDPAGTHQAEARAVAHAKRNVEKAISIVEGVTGQQVLNTFTAWEADLIANPYSGPAINVTDIASCLEGYGQCVAWLTQWRTLLAAGLAETLDGTVIGEPIGPDADANWNVESTPAVMAYLRADTLAAQAITELADGGIIDRTSLGGASWNPDYVPGGTNGSTLDDVADRDTYLVALDRTAVTVPGGREALEGEVSAPVKSWPVVNKLEVLS